jgi:hypothetical protein
MALSYFPNVITEMAAGFGLHIDCHHEYEIDTNEHRQPGRPRTIVDCNQVLEALSIGYSARDIAKSSIKILGSDAQVYVLEVGA